MVALTLSEKLHIEIEQIRQRAHLTAVAVAAFDAETGAEFLLNADRSFHAASTFKAAILLAFVRAVESGQVKPGDHLQIRNRFVSVTGGLPFRIARERDGDSSVHAQVGRSLTLLELARVMITRSSNLATNLLLDFLTAEQVRAAVRDSGIEGLEVRRGVEDLAAHEAGINNETTARGLGQLYRSLLPGGGLSPAAQVMALKILHAQEFNRMLPARLPKGVRVAHKTGEISTHSHDAGLVYPPTRAPYVVAILTEHAAEAEGVSHAVAEISAVIYRHFVP